MKAEGNGMASVFLYLLSSSPLGNEIFNVWNSKYEKASFVTSMTSPSILQLYPPDNASWKDIGLVFVQHLEKTYQNKQIRNMSFNIFSATFQSKTSSIPQNWSQNNPPWAVRFMELGPHHFLLHWLNYRTYKTFGLNGIFVMDNSCLTYV